MKKFILIFFITVFFTKTSTIDAIEPPVQDSPASGSAVTVTTMKWNIPSYTLYDGDHYRVQVDDDLNFTSINKDYTTGNNTYTPTGLAEGTWYWKVKAKSSIDGWSDWSSIWSFILVTPTPTPTENSTPTPTNTPTQTPTPTITKTPTPTKKITTTPTKVLQKNSSTPSETSVNLPQSILGTSVSPTDTPTPTKINDNSFNFMNLIFIAGGIILILAGALVFTFVAKGKFKDI